VENGYKYNRFSEANDRVTFKTTDGSASKIKGKNKKITCYKCKNKGHYANKSDEDYATTKMLNKKGSNFMNQGQFSKIEEGSTEGDTSDEDVEGSDDKYRFAITLYALYKISQQFPRCGFCLIANRPLTCLKLLTNICDRKRKLILYCNAGKAIITNKGDLKGYGTV